MLAASSQKLVASLRHPISRQNFLRVIIVNFRLIAQHFIVKGGLRNFADVVSYLRNPLVLVFEVLFLVCVATHAMLGVRSILLDFGLSDRAEQWLSRVLTGVGILTVGYGLLVTWAIIH